MSPAWFWGIGIAIDVVAAILYVLAVREQKRIAAQRERLRRDRRHGFGDGLAGDFPRGAP